MIIHVVYECNPEEFRGGVQKVAFELAVAQSRLGHNVEIWSLSNETIDDVLVEGLRIRYFDCLSVFGVKYSKVLAKKLLAKRDSIDVIHSHNTFHPLNYQIYLFSKKNQKKVAYHPHGALDPNLFKGYSFDSIKKKLYIFLFERRLLKAANVVFALTDIEKQQLSSFGVEQNVYVIPNGVGDKKIVTKLGINKEYQIPKDSFVFLYVGRIVSKKGLHDFIEAFYIVNQLKPNNYFIIAGNDKQDPNYTNVLLQLIEKFQLQDSVRFWGFVNEANNINVLLNAKAA